MQKPHTCRGCPLEHKGLGFSRPEGRGSNGVLGIGESLGYEEYMDGLPFRPKAPAGSALEKAFNLDGFERHEFRLWNLIACHPPNNKVEGMDYAEGALQHCRKNHFDRVLGNHIANARDKSPVLLAFGNLPLKELTGVSGEAKDKQSITSLRGYVFPAKNYSGVWVIGSYHPSYIRRGNAKFFPALMDDISKAVEVADGSFDWFKGGRNYVEPTYNIHPSLDDVESYARLVSDNVNQPLAMDIETPKTGEMEEDEREDIEQHKITLIQFSLGKREGIAIPFQYPYLESIRKILKSKNLKLGFNWWGFDAERVKAEGFEVEGLPHDLMVMFSKYLPGLRKNLQAVASYARFPFAWKHLYGTNLEWYGCADVDSLHWIWEWLPGEMKKLGVWKQYYEQVYRYKIILDRGSRVGMPVDDSARGLLSESMVRESECISKELGQLDSN